jgi:GAF domain-containing protein/HAMP domain-containing protein
MIFVDQLRERFKNFSLFFKFQVALFVVAMVTLSVMGFFGYNEGRKLLSERSFNLLTNITKTKKKAIENYFQDIKNQIIVLADNPITLQALNEFKDGYSPKLSAKDLSVADSTLGRFYEQDYLKLLEYNSLQPFKNIFKPNNPAQIWLQYKYITQNPNPQGFRSLFKGESFNEPYDLAHQKFHPAFLKQAQKFGYTDILLIDRDGNVVYSTAKKVDFASNFKNGPFHNNNAARLYRKLMQSRDEDPVKFEDFENYWPSTFSPACFVGIPIYDNQSKGIKAKLGVLLIQLSDDKINEILTNNQQWAEEGLGVSGETALIGADFKLRNNTRRFLEDANAYVTALQGKAENTVLEKIKRLKTTVLLREYKTQASMDALAGKVGNKTNIDFLGNEVLDVYLPVDVLGVRWAMLTEMDGAEMFASTYTLANQLLIIALVLFVAVTLLGAYLAKSLSDPMRKMQKEITMLSEGNFPKTTKKIYRDELGKIDAALNTLISNMKEVASFAENVGQSNYDYPFKARGQNDVLGHALLQMRDNLKKLANEEKERNWINSGAALFGEILRNNSNDIDKLAQVTIAELVKYLSANQGAFFIFDDKIKKLRIVSAYAYGKYKYLEKNIDPGEGLIGQVFLEKEKMYLTEIPNDYSPIQSGLGFAKPRCILVMPLLVNNQVYGVIELASLDDFKPFEIALVESVSEDIAITLANIKQNEETKRLLQESIKATQQLRQQEEEMRQNFEELMATQDEMKKRQEQIDLLLHGKITVQDLAKMGVELKNDSVEANQDWLNQIIQEAIVRQKELLDDASNRNLKKQELIQSKVNKSEKGSNGQA